MKTMFSNIDQIDLSPFEMILYHLINNLPQNRLIWLDCRIKNSSINRLTPNYNNIKIKIHFSGMCFVST